MSNLAEKDVDLLDLQALNNQMAALNPVQRVEMAFDVMPNNYIVSSSFGAQSAVMLHLLTQVMPDIPVILTDTGYLFAETYQFIDRLTEELSLNLHVYKAPVSGAWQEARYGKLWEKGLEGIEQFNKLNKVEPMQRALHEHKAGTWFAGLRRDQSDSRETIPFAKRQAGLFKVYPIADQSNRDIHAYLQKHRLPYHPLWEKGYVSIGDWHSSSPLKAGMTEQETRFFGLKRECGLHEFGDGEGI